MGTEHAKNVVAKTTVVNEILSFKKTFYGFDEFVNGFMFDLGQIYLLKMSVLIIYRWCNVGERSFMASTRQAGSIGAQLVTGVAFVPMINLGTLPTI